MRTAFALVLLLLARPAAALELAWQPGTWIVDDPLLLQLSLGAEPVTLRGAGKGQTRLILAQGFDIAYADPCAAPEVTGLTLMTAAAGGGTALAITGPLLPTATCQGPRVIDVAVTGVNPIVHFWNRGVLLRRTWNAILRDINVKGMDQNQPDFLMGVGVEFDTSQVVDIEKLDVYHAQIAVRQSGATYGEGFSLRDFNLVGVDKGILLLQGAGYVIADGHINAYSGCADLQGKSQIVIRAVLCYKTHISARSFVGFNLLWAQMVHVANTTVDGGWEPAHANAGATYGWVLMLTNRSYFGGNLCTGFRVPSVCIVVGYQSRDNIFIANRSDGAGPAVSVNPDAGANNLLSVNKP